MQIIIMKLHTFQLRMVMEGMVMVLVSGERLLILQILLKKLK